MFVVFVYFYVVPERLILGVIIVVSEYVWTLLIVIKNEVLHFKLRKVSGLW